MQNILPMQRLLEDETMRTNMLKYLPDEELAEAVRKQWEGAAAGGAGSRGSKAAAAGGDVNLQRWRMLEREVQIKVREGGYFGRGHLSGGPVGAEGIQKGREQGETMGSGCGVL